MMRLARDRGVRTHDLWGVAPPGAGPDHPWHGVGLFKKGFGEPRSQWAGSWDLVVDPTLLGCGRPPASADGCADEPRAQDGPRRPGRRPRPTG